MVRRHLPAVDPLTAPNAGRTDGRFKCSMHGATLPVAQMEPGLPLAWTCCRACWARNQDAGNPWKNPLGPSPDKGDLMPDPAPVEPGGCEL